MQDSSKKNLNLQIGITAVAIALFVIKIFAWQLTHSVAILTDALESTVNVVAGFLGIYSLYISAKPKDIDHPYGHGKIEFITSAIEGTLIGIAGLLIIYKAISNLFITTELHDLDIGLLLIAASAIVNFIVGRLAILQGKRTKSLALIASGKHLYSDTWSTIGIIAGLIAVYITGYTKIDSLCAIFFAIIILYTAIKILRDSVAGIMDEADDELLIEVIDYCYAHRAVDWIDLHNMRIIKYGSLLHLDCHLTLPWYYNLIESHAEVENLEKLVKEKFNDSIELFVHTDACIPSSCSLCLKQDCLQRQSAFINEVKWSVENVRLNKKHSIETKP